MVMQRWHRGKMLLVRLVAQHLFLLIEHPLVQVREAHSKLVWWKVQTYLEILGNIKEAFLKIYLILTLVNLILVKIGVFRAAE